MNLVTENLGEKMFNAYNSEGSNPWRTWDGKEVPRWHELNDQVRGKWAAAAREAIEQLGSNAKPAMTIAEANAALDADVEAKRG